MNDGTRKGQPVVPSPDEQRERRNAAWQELGSADPNVWLDRAHDVMVERDRIQHDVVRVVEAGQVDRVEFWLREWCDETARDEEYVALARERVEAPRPEPEAER